MTPYRIFQCDRAKLAKEKQLKEEALKEKADLERKLSQMQDEVRTAQEMLVCLWSIESE
jgi:merlin protein